MLINAGCRVLQDDLDLLLDSPSSLTVTVSWTSEEKDKVSHWRINSCLWILCGWSAGVCVFSQSNTRGTVRDKANFSADEDVSALRKAMEGLGGWTHIIFTSSLLKFKMLELQFDTFMKPLSIKRAAQRVNKRQGIKLSRKNKQIRNVKMGP